MRLISATPSPRSRRAPQPSGVPSSSRATSTTVTSAADGFVPGLLLAAVARPDLGLLLAGQPLDVGVVPEGRLDLHSVTPCSSSAASSR